MSAPEPTLATDPVRTQDFRQWQEELYQQLHRNPELSGVETATAARVATELDALGFTVTTGVGGTGVVGILTRGSGGPRVAMRAELDALPILEATGLPYASRASGTARDGTVTPVMHACGHDVHLTCLLGACRLLADDRADWRGTAIAIFQPAEETGEGAQAMIDDGLAAVTGPVDVVLAQHVMARPVGSVYVPSGQVFAAARNLTVTIHGRSGHASAPHTTVDPIVIAAAVVLRLQTVVAREIAPEEFAVLTVGSLHAGTSGNSIPESAVLQLNLRYFTEEVGELMVSAIHRIAHAECAAAGAPRAPEVHTGVYFPPTTNDEQATVRVRDAFTTALDPGQVSALPRQSASEDFSRLTSGLGAPGCYWGLGGTAPADADNPPSNHSSRFAPPVHPTLGLGTTAMTVAALAWLGPPSGS